MRYLTRLVVVATGILTCAWAACGAADPQPTTKPAPPAPKTAPAPHTASTPTTIPQVPPPRPVGISTAVIDGNSNTVIVGNQGKGTTLILSARQGKNNRVLVQNGQVLDLDKLCYKGKNNNFWSWTRPHPRTAAMLYWCPKTSLWFRYFTAEDCYRPALDLYLEAADEAAQRTQLETMEAFERAQRNMRNFERMFDSFRQY